MEIKENQALARGRSLPVSTKQCVEICSFLRGKKLSKAQTDLEKVLDFKQAVPYKRHKHKIPHRSGNMAAGRYPLKASKEMLKILRSVEANAKHKGLSTNLKIIHILANKASSPMHHGRIRGRSMKRTHLEIVVEEQSKKVEKPTPKNKVKDETKIIGEKND